MTPFTGCKYAMMFEVAAVPLFVKPNETVTVSPGSMVPLGGEKLSLNKVAPAAIMFGTGLAAVITSEAVLLAGLGSFETVLTVTVFV